MWNSYRICLARSLMTTFAREMVKVKLFQERVVAMVRLAIIDDAIASVRFAEHDTPQRWT